MLRAEEDDRLFFFCNKQTQRNYTEKKIREDFEELRLFLGREEEARIAALKEEETQKINVMQRLTDLHRDTLSLSDTVKDIEKDLGPNSLFMQVIIQSITKMQTK